MRKIGKCWRLLAIAGLLLGAVSCMDDGADEEPIAYTSEREAGIITDFIQLLESEGMDVDTTDLGIYYTIEEAGDGAFVQEGDSIGIEYIGYFPESGNVFDRSSYWYDNGKWQFVYPTSGLIPGFNDALAQLHEGDTGIFLIPSDLAYGIYGSSSGVIPPYSALVFLIKLVEIYPSE